MVCLSPKIAYQRRFFPADGNKSEKNLKRLNKISFHYQKGWKQIEIPCGECPACRLSKANEWATRIECESKTWNGTGIFVTLTYNNPNLPTNSDGQPTLVKSDIQKFIKRLRKHNKGIYTWENPYTKKIENPIRTFECGEYGPKNGRPHYHMIIFNWEPNDLKQKQISKDGFPLFTSKSLQKIWGKGFVLIGKISYESASYVARYTMKKNGLAKTKREYYDVCEPDEETKKLIMKTKYRTKKGKVEQEFITMSSNPGIGAKYFFENIEKIKKNNGILINIKGTTKLKKIPRYFRKIWEKTNWEDFERWRYRNKILEEQKEIKRIEQYKLPENWYFQRKQNFVRQIIIDKQKHKFNLLKRNNILYDVEEDNDKDIA